MLKSIFGKLMAMFSLLLVFGFLVAGGILYYFLSDYAVKDKVQLVENSAKRVENYFLAYLGSYENLAARIVFERSMEFFSSYSNSMIWIVEKNGHIFHSEPALPKRITQNLIDDTGYPLLPDKRQYERVMSGREISLKGDFYGFFDDGEGPWLTIAKPIFRQGKEVIGAIYFHTPIPELQRARSTVFRLFLTSVFISLAVSALLVYVFSKTLSKPLKQIKSAARVIANGEFQNRLDIRSRDEIGELAVSFNQMASALQKLEEVRRSFIANVSHELRTPMTTIRGFVEGILDGTIPSERHETYLGIVKEETERLNRLVNDLLDLAKMEAGELSLDMRDFEINELLRRTVIKLENLIVGKNLQVEAFFEEESTYVNADPDAIERVVLNLLHNAIKFTDPGGRIRVSTAVSKERVFVSVEDDGMGIEKDEIDFIGERFYQSDKSRGKDKSGTGLGLAIIKNIINEHRQEIWVESEPGKGSKFTFTLKRA